jgi:hypothetical protein
MKKLTINEVKQEFINRNLIPLFNEYKNNSIKLLAKTQEGYYVVINLSNLKCGKMPNVFDVYNPYTIQNIKLWCKLNNKSFKLISNKYEGCEKHLEWQCLKIDCNEKFRSRWNNIGNNNNNCPYCCGQRVGLSNCLATKNPELASEWHPTKNGDLTPYDVTCGTDKKVWWICDKHHYWEASISHRSFGTGCPKCNKSKGEKRINEYFDNNNIYHICQKEFPNLLGLGNGQLSYDFYLSNYNLLIEYQGLQHEKYCKGLHKSKEAFSIQQEHDIRKREYAQNNNINLLEIWYYDFENIEKILDKYLIK